MSSLTLEDAKEIDRFNANIHDALIAGCKIKIRWLTLPLGFAIVTLFVLYQMEGAAWWIMFFPTMFNSYSIWKEFKKMKSLQKNPPPGWPM